ncbi:MAG: hypothetical protein KIS94_03950 [Chitinophagales bacterium]|nr:hypothetical protein [Chitinophagales bacterium]
MSLRCICKTLVVIVCLLGSCKSTKQAAVKEVPAVEEEITDLSFRKIIKDKELFAATTETIALDSARLSNDTLHLYTKKLQACDADNFKLLWNGSMAKSLPPQASLKLLFINEPSCREQHRFHLTYNISSVRFKGDSVTKGATLLKLPGFNSGLLYEFGEK